MTASAVGIMGSSKATPLSPAVQAQAEYDEPFQDGGFRLSLPFPVAVQYQMLVLRPCRRDENKPLNASLPTAKQRKRANKGAAKK